MVLLADADVPVETGTLSYTEAAGVVEALVEEAQRRSRKRYPWSEIVQAAYVVGALRARLIEAVRRGYVERDGVDGGVSP